MWRKQDFDYRLPTELIAQTPVKPRDFARLLLVNKHQKKIQHDIFYHLDKYLKPGDLLVVNDSKVIPARLFGKKKSGGQLEVFLLKQLNSNHWQCLLKGKIKLESEIILSKNLQAVAVKQEGAGVWQLKFNQKNPQLNNSLFKLGQTPLPPYIRRGLATQADYRHYQTVYANEQQAGSVAAPTAGLHFTNRLLKKISQVGVELATVTLHVGLGTFQPVKVEDIRQHQMHQESLIISPINLQKIIQARQRGRRIIAVGTTSCRSLETLAQHLQNNLFSVDNKLSRQSYFQANTDIFIYPGYQFLLTDALITNFHLPQSTLLMLVFALAGKKLIDQAYHQAIQQKYRFFSYGDAMFIY